MLCQSGVPGKGLARDNISQQCCSRTVLFPYGDGTPRRFRKAETSAGSSSPVGSAAGRDSVTDNFLAAARKFPRPRLATSPAGSVSAPSFESRPPRKNTFTLYKVKVFFAFARRTGLEPATSHVTGGCSNQLSYHRKYSYNRKLCLPILS